MNEFANVNGTKICHTIDGDGFPVILIHGYGGKKEIWKANVKALFKKFKVITCDVRGAGKSDRPNIPYTMKMLADDVKGLMEYLDLEKAHVCGRSLGGMIAQHFFFSYPECVDKLILMTTNYGMPTVDAVEMMKNARIDELALLKEDPEKAFWNKSRFLFHQKFRKEMAANPEKIFHDTFSAASLINENTINPSTPQDLENLANAMKGHSTFDRLKEITCQTLLIAASHDKLTPRSVMVEMQEQIPNSTLKSIEKAGHYVNMSRAPEVNEIILAFLES